MKGKISLCISSNISVAEPIFLKTCHLYFSLPSGNMGLNSSPNIFASSSLCICNWSRPFINNKYVICSMFVSGFVEPSVHKVVQIASTLFFISPVSIKSPFQKSLKMFLMISCHSYFSLNNRSIIFSGSSKNVLVML